VLVLAAFVAEGEVLGELEVVEGVGDRVEEEGLAGLQVQGRVEEGLCVAFAAREAFVAFPLALGDVLNRRVEAKRVEGLVTDVTVEQVGLLSCARADLTELAVEALPVGLELGDQSLVLGLLLLERLLLLLLLRVLLRALLARPYWLQLQAVGMEGLATEGAGEKVLPLAEGPAQVAHLLEDELGVVERTPRRVRVVTPLVVYLLVIVHHQLLVLLNVVGHWLVYRGSRVRRLIILLHAFSLEGAHLFLCVVDGLV
jgi:hypothetical protein